MFNFIKNKLQKVFSAVTCKLGVFFNKKTIDETALKELEILLLSSDVGFTTTKMIIDELKKTVMHNTPSGNELKKVMHTLLLHILTKKTFDLSSDKKVFLFVGINGSGKTTSISKLASLYAAQGKKVLLVAADTFRAAATEQLNEWAKRADVDILCGQEGQDPASLVFQGCEKFKKENYDILIIDTAGRLQTKINLMHELSKIKRCITKQLPSYDIITLLTIDAMLGQNSFEQSKLFKESTDVSGIILTKMDGTGKGGIVFSIAQELEIPIAFITFGEQLDHIKSFDAQEYIAGLLG